MMNLPQSGEEAKGPGRGLWRAAWAAVGSGVAGVFLGVLAMGSSGSDGALIQGALIFGVVGMAISLGILVIAIVARFRYPGELLGQLSVLLPIPFLLVQPLCYFQALGLGLGGDTAAAAFYGYLAWTSLILAAVTFIGGVVAAIRSRGPSEGVK